MAQTPNLIDIRIGAIGHEFEASEKKRFGEGLDEKTA